MVKATTLQQRLVSEIEKIPVIDCHEHLGPEEWRVARNVDATILFSHYCRTDLITAGMPPGDFDRMCDDSLDADLHWDLISPWLPYIRHGGYARAGLIAARELFGFEDVNDANHGEVTARLREHNTAGLQRRVLREKCNIRLALTQCGQTEVGMDLLAPLLWIHPVTDYSTWDDIVRQATAHGVTPRSLEDLVEVIGRQIRAWKSEGAIGIKLWAVGRVEPDQREAASEFERLRTGAEGALPGWGRLRAYLLDEAFRLAATHGMTVACHTGMWGDFRTLDPTNLIPVLERHPETRFDIYHAGMPYVRETGVMGKNYPNSYLNLAWCHAISPRMTVSLLDEWLDLVPVNKILGFGGDYEQPIEKVVGALWLGRRNIAEVLTSRIERGELTEDRALQIARLWLWENPQKCYPDVPRLLRERGLGE
jgi:uncharacterized protein